MMRKRLFLQLRRPLPLLCLLPALAAPAQYTGKVDPNPKEPVLRATAVYEFTGSMTKPNASRLVPVVVWDGSSYHPGGLYLAQPEPLAVAPGTQYQLEQSGVPVGLFDISSAGQLSNGLGSSWVGLGRFKVEAPPAPEPKLKPSRKLPVLNGPRGGKSGTAEEGEAGGPVLHRKAGSEGDAPVGSASPSAGPQSAPKPSTVDPDRPTLHRRESDSSGSNTPDAQQKPEAAPAPDPDRPTLHRQAAGAESTPAAPDPDRPTLHRHAEGAEATTTAPDPDRPHLRYGAGEDNSPVLPVELKDSPAPGAAAGSGAIGAAAQPVAIGQVVAISDTADDEAHPYSYTWPTPAAQATAQDAMHALALAALNKAAQATFGPAAASDAALRQAAAAAQASFGPASARRRAAAKTAKAAGSDPLLDPQFRAFELSYGGGATYVYTAHTAPTGQARRYVTVIARPDFSGKAQLLFSQTTRGDRLTETPALHLIDAADVDGDHRAELLFDQQILEPTGPRTGPAPARLQGRNFALFDVTNGQADEVYASWTANSLH